MVVGEAGVGGSMVQVGPGVGGAVAQLAPLLVGGPVAQLVRHLESIFGVWLLYGVACGGQLGPTRFGGMPVMPCTRIELNLQSVSNRIE